MPQAIKPPPRIDARVVTGCGSGRLVSAPDPLGERGPSPMHRVGPFRGLPQDPLRSWTDTRPRFAHRNPWSMCVMICAMEEICNEKF